MKTHKNVIVPCVIWHQGRPDEQHLVHSTHWRAQRNALMTADYGAVYHVHKTTRRTLWGWLTRAAVKEDESVLEAALNKLRWNAEPQRELLMLSAPETRALLQLLERERGL